MKEAKLLLQGLLDDARKSQNGQSKASVTFIVIKNEIVSLLKKIESCENVDEAKQYFDELQWVQEILAELLFKFDVKMPNELIKFVGDCDRLDDERLRNYLFRKIKNGEYSLL